MLTLLLKLKDHTVLKGNFPLHCLLADYYNIDFDNIIAVGFVTKGREIWDNRKPH